MCMKKTDRRNGFIALLKKHGYDNVAQFCEANNLIATNMNKRLRGDQKIEILFLFKIANILHEPIETMIEIFYPDELAENRSLIEQ